MQLCIKKKLEGRTTCYIPDMYLYKVLLALFLLLCTSVVAAAAAAVRHRVPDGINCCWFVESIIPSSVFLFLQTRFVFMYVPLGSIVAFTASICLYYELAQPKNGQCFQKLQRHRFYGLGLENWKR